MCCLGANAEESVDIRQEDFVGAGKRRTGPPRQRGNELVARPCRSCGHRTRESFSYASFLDDRRRRCAAATTDALLPPPRTTRYLPGRVLRVKLVLFAFIIFSTADWLLEADDDAEGDRGSLTWWCCAAGEAPGAADPGRRKPPAWGAPVPLLLPASLLPKLALRGMPPAVAGRFTGELKGDGCCCCC